MPHMEDLRAMIVLHAADGLSNKAIGECAGGAYTGARRLAQPSRSVLFHLAAQGADPKRFSRSQAAWVAIE